MLFLASVCKKKNFYLTAYAKSGLSNLLNVRDPCVCYMHYIFMGKQADILVRAKGILFREYAAYIESN